MENFKLQSTLGFIGLILLLIGFVFVIIGMLTITSPLSQAINQTSNTFPQYIIGALTSDLIGTVILVIGVIFILLGFLIVRHS